MIAHIGRTCHLSTKSANILYVEEFMITTSDATKFPHMGSLQYIENVVIFQTWITMVLKEGGYWGHTLRYILSLNVKIGLHYCASTIRSS